MPGNKVGNNVCFFPKIIFWIFCPDNIDQDHLSKVEDHYVVLQFQSFVAKTFVNIWCTLAIVHQRKQFPISTFEQFVAQKKNWNPLVPLLQLGQLWNHRKHRKHWKHRKHRGKNAFGVDDGRATILKQGVKFSSGIPRIIVWLVEGVVAGLANINSNYFHNLMFGDHSHARAASCPIPTNYVIKHPHRQHNSIHRKRMKYSNLAFPPNCFFLGGF